MCLYACELEPFEIVDYHSAMITDLQGYYNIYLNKR